MANEKLLIDLWSINMEEVDTSDCTDIEDILSAVITYLSELPTVDAVEVVHGWWIELPGMEPDYKCSECGRSYAWWEPSEAHYCPNCGAKMDGDGNG